MFISALRQYPVIRHACDVAGIGRTTATDWRKADPAFDAEVRAAIEDGVERLEADVFRRANGADVDRPSDLLSIFTLKAHKPELYRERVDHRITGKVTHEIVIDLVDPVGPDPDIVDAELVDAPDPRSTGAITPAPAAGHALEAGSPAGGGASSEVDGA